MPRRSPLATEMLPMLSARRSCPTRANGDLRRHRRIPTHELAGRASSRLPRHLVAPLGGQRSVPGAGQAFPESEADASSPVLVRVLVVVVIDVRMGVLLREPPRTTAIQVVEIGRAHVC